MKFNPGIEIDFENKKFRHCIDETDFRFDTYVLKSKGNILKFESEGFNVIIETCKFPNGLYGFGFYGNALSDSQQCHCHGVIGRITFIDEFSCQVEAIQYVLKYFLRYDYHRDIIREKMKVFINPKTLF